MAKGIIYLETMPVSPDREEDYHTWYNDTHLAEICSVDGIVSARRFAPTDGTGPFIGPYLSDFLRAGPEFGATTLSRFYAIHMMLIPGLIAALIGAHLYLVTKLGISAPPWMKAVEDQAPEMHETQV